MAASRKKSDAVRPLPTTIEGVEKHLVALAIQDTEEKLRNGTASNAVVIHYLKLGTVQHQVEMEKLRNEAKLADARAQQIASTERTEELYKDAIKHFGSYQTGVVPDDDEY